MSWPTPLWAVLTNPGYPVKSALSPVLVAQCKEGTEWGISSATNGSVAASTAYKLIGNDSVKLTAYGNGDVYAYTVVSVNLSAKDRFIFAVYVSVGDLALAAAATVLRIRFQNTGGPNRYYDIPARSWGAGWNIIESGKSEWTGSLDFAWDAVTRVDFDLRSPAPNVNTVLYFENVYGFTRTASYPIAQIYVEPGGDSGWRLEAATAKNYPLGASFPVIHDLGYTNYTREWAGVVRSQHQLQNILSCVKKLVILRGPRDAGVPAWCDGERGPSIHDIGETVPKWRKTLSFERRDVVHLQG